MAVKNRPWCPRQLTTIPSTFTLPGVVCHRHDRALALLQKGHESNTYWLRGGRDFHRSPLHSRFYAAIRDPLTRTLQGL